MASEITSKKRLPAWMKLLHGSCDWGFSSGGMMRSIFYAIYMTDVVGHAYDAMTSHRPYRHALSDAEAIRELVNFSGKQFDPFLVKVFIKTIDDKNLLPDTMTVHLDSEGAYHVIR